MIPNQITKLGHELKQNELPILKKNRNEAGETNKKLFSLGFIAKMYLQNIIRYV